MPLPLKNKPLNYVTRKKEKKNTTTIIIFTDHLFVLKLAEVCKIIAIITANWNGLPPIH